jgi:DNA-3-methyladenine glycosylase
VTPRHDPPGPAAPRGPDAPTPLGADAPTPLGADEPIPRGADAPIPRGPDTPTPGGPDAPVPPGAELLPRDFFARPSVEVAPDLLGCVIAHETPEGLVGVMLTEVEAYDGENDPASHAYHGRTARNAVMFGPPGHVYVYFTYGMHFCMNLVCQPEHGASAVLLRAGRVVDGVPLATARRARHLSRSAPRGVDLARGPARLCEALAVDLSHDGADAVAPASPLRALAAQALVPAADISRGPRVGISRATDVPWRFWITGEPTVSPYRAYAARRARAKPVTGTDREGGTIPP